MPALLELAALADADGVHLLLARQSDGPGDDTVVGMLTLVVFRTPTGIRSLIEDVVVDEAVRGRGVGEWLYERVGFVRRDKNVYRFTVNHPRAAR